MNRIFLVAVGLAFCWQPISAQTADSQAVAQAKAIADAKAPQAQSVAAEQTAAAAQTQGAAAAQGQATLPAPNIGPSSQTVPANRNQMPSAPAFGSPATAPRGLASGTAGDSNKKVSISLPRATGNEVAQFYRELTGKRVLVDATAAAMEVNIVVFGDGEDKDDAVRAFEKALLLAGIVVTPSGPNEVKLVAMPPGAKNPKIEGVPVIAASEDIPEGDQVITYVMQLEHITPEEASRIFTSTFGSLHAYGSITAIPSVSALVITENASLIKTFVQLKEQMDVPSAQVSTKWVQVQFADVEELSARLDTLMNGKNSGQGMGSGNRQFTPPPPVGGGNPEQQGTTTIGGNRGNSVPVQIVPDSRTNRIFLFGRPVDLVFLQNLVDEFDAPSDTRNFKRIKLSNLRVSDFLPAAQNALTTLLTPGSPASQQALNTMNRGQGMASGFQRNQGMAGGGGMGQSSRSGSSSSADEDVLQDPQASGAPESVLVGRTLLVADTITNSVIVQGPPQSVDIVSNLAAELDRRGPQVMISTVFGQFRKTDGESLGVEWVNTVSGNGDRDLLAGQNRPGGTDVRDISLLKGIADFASNVAGLSLYGRFGKHMNFYLNAAMSTGKFQVLSRPTIFTTNNTKAVISSGQKVPVPSSTYQDTTNPNSFNTTIEYRDVLLKLEVVPLINSDKEVTLQISQVNDQVIGSQTIGANSVPVIGSEKLLTTVTVPSGGTVILGGLVSKEQTKEKKGIPYLSRIPLLGNLFSSTETSTIERELVVFIQPQVISGDTSALRSQVNERNRYEVMPELIDFATPTAQPVSNQPMPGVMENPTLEGAQNRPSWLKRTFGRQNDQNRVKPNRPITGLHSSQFSSPTSR